MSARDRLQQIADTLLTMALNSHARAMTQQKSSVTFSLMSKVLSEADCAEFLAQTNADIQKLIQTPPAEATPDFAEMLTTQVRGTS